MATSYYKVRVKTTSLIKKSIKPFTPISTKVLCGHCETEDTIYSTHCCSGCHGVAVACASLTFRTSTKAELLGILKQEGDGLVPVKFMCTQFDATKCTWTAMTKNPYAVVRFKFKPNYVMLDGAPQLPGIGNNERPSIQGLYLTIEDTDGSDSDSDSHDDDNDDNDDDQNEPDNDDNHNELGDDESDESHGYESE